MSRRCDLAPEDLVAYASGELEPDQRLAVEAHLPRCADCRAWLRASEQLGRLLRTRFPAVDDPAARARVMERIRARAEQPSRSPRRMPVLGARMLPLVAIFVAVVLAVVSVSSSSRAGLSLERFIDFTVEEARRVSPLPSGSEPRPTGIVAGVTPVTKAPHPSFRAVEPPSLPLDLVIDQRTLPTPDRLELRYRNDAGLVIRLSQTPAVPSLVSLSRSDDDTTALIAVEKVEVLWLKDPHPNSVAGLLWESNGVFFELLVLDGPSGDAGALALPDARQIVAALLAAQAEEAE